MMFTSILVLMLLVRVLKNVIPIFIIIMSLAFLTLEIQLHVSIYDKI